jgi:hypothetical protein
VKSLLAPVSIPKRNPLAVISGRVQAWAVESQQGARRNAMVASTALAARRAERQDVDAYFASLVPPVNQGPVVVHR